MMHKAWCSIKEVHYYFSGTSIKFQGHTGWKIDDLNPIGVRLLGQSQLSNPSDLPCYAVNGFVSHWNGHDTVYMIWIFVVGLCIEQCKLVDRTLFFVIHCFLDNYVNLINHGYLIIKKTSFFVIHNTNIVWLWTADSRIHIHKVRWEDCWCRLGVSCE